MALITHGVKPLANITPSGRGPLTVIQITPKFEYDVHNSNIYI